jgi:hypothetical protein
VVGGLVLLHLVIERKRMRRRWKGKILLWKMWMLKKNTEEEEGGGVWVRVVQDIACTGVFL